MTQRSTTLFTALQGSAWIVALIGYFGPWIGHPAAALAWNAYDCFDILRYLPQIEAFAISVNLQALRLPLLGLAVLLPLLFAESPPLRRWGAALVGIGLAALTLPPYPEIIGAWHTPGWNVPFWWSVGTAIGTALSAGIGPRWGGLRPWLMLAWTLLTGIPAFVTCSRLLPSIHALHGTQTRSGWGLWLCAAGLLILAGTAWLAGFSRRKETP